MIPQYICTRVRSCNVLKFTSTTTSTELAEYFFSSFSRVLIFKSGSILACGEFPLDGYITFGAAICP